MVTFDADILTYAILNFRARARSVQNPGMGMLTGSDTKVENDVTTANCNKP